MKAEEFMKLDDQQQWELYEQLDADAAGEKAEKESWKLEARRLTMLLEGLGHSLHAMWRTCVLRTDPAPASIDGPDIGDLPGSSHSTQDARTTTGRSGPSR